MEALINKLAAENKALKAKMAAKAVAEGRKPGLIGRPPRLTPEEKEAARLAQNKKRSK